MIPRRLAALGLLPLLGVPASAPRGMAVQGPEPRRNCGDPGGSFIACSAIQETLPPREGAACPICGGRHRVAAAP